MDRNKVNKKILTIKPRGRRKVGRSRFILLENEKKI